MPIYEYVCDSCGHDFERQQSFHDAPVSTCPVCGKVSVRRLISSVGVVFKGSGWYVNDSKRKSSGEKSGVSDTKASETASTTDSGDGAGAGTSPEAPAKAGETSGAAGDGKATEASSGSSSSDAGENKSKTAKKTSGDSASGASSSTTEKSKKNQN